MIGRVPEELWPEVPDFVQEAVIKTIPKKRREAKGKGEKERYTCNVGDLGSVPGLGRSPGGGHGNPLQYSCLENIHGRGAWWATVHGVAKFEHD